MDRSRFKFLTAFTGILAASISLYFLYGVSVSVQLTGEPTLICPLEKPIAIHVRNWTFSKVRDVQMKIYLYSNDISDNLLKDSIFNLYRFNAVLAPFQSRTACIGDEYISNYLGAKKTEQGGSEETVKFDLNNELKVINQYKRFYPQHKIYASEIKVSFMN